MTELTRVLLKQSSDPNQVGNAGAHLGGCLWRVGEGVVERLELSDDGNWVIVNSKRGIAREMTLHIEFAPHKRAAEPAIVEADGGVVCPACGDEFKNRQALGGHKKSCARREASG